MKTTYDIIIIGGGSTGSGLALDATLRGYKTLLVEKDDFSSKASSNSSKLVHGGIRYLEKAILQGSFKQFSLVTEALKERYYFLKNSCNMSSKVRLHTLVTSFVKQLYLFCGLKLYDFLSFSKSLGPSQADNQTKTQKHFSFLLSGYSSIHFYDGTFNDMRVNLCLLKSAQSLGCDLYNYHEVKEFIYENKKLIGVTIFDKIQEKTLHIKSKVIINATGYFCDKLRTLDDENSEPIISLSKGSHLVLDSSIQLKNRAILIDKTTDNRVLFILPWQNHTLVGTTETLTKLDESPTISQEEIEYLLENINPYLTKKVTKKNILSHFSSIRPLINDSSKKSSENMVREHCILKSKSNLITLAGGKWTTYRKMAEECLDFIILEKQLPYKKQCQTKSYKLFGNHHKILLQDLEAYNLSDETKAHLIYHYGDKTQSLLDEFSGLKMYEPLNKNHPYILAELYYTMKYEFVYFPNDFLFRRIGLGKVDLKTTRLLLSTVVEHMAKHYQWSDTKTLTIYQDSLKEIHELLQAIS